MDLCADDLDSANPNSVSFVSGEIASDRGIPLSGACLLVDDAVQSLPVLLLPILDRDTDAEFDGRVSPRHLPRRLWQFGPCRAMSSLITESRTALGTKGQSCRCATHTDRMNLIAVASGMELYGKFPCPLTEFLFSNSSVPGSFGFRCASIQYWHQHSRCGCPGGRFPNMKYRPKYAVFAEVLPVVLGMTMT